MSYQINSYLFKHYILQNNGGTGQSMVSSTLKRFEPKITNNKIYDLSPTLPMF